MSTFPVPSPLPLTITINSHDLRIHLEELDRQEVFDQWKSSEAYQNGHKIPDQLESQITTNTLLKVSDYVVDTFHHWGLTPNSITTLGAICGLLAIGCVACYDSDNHKQTVKFLRFAALLYLMCYLFDCIDGPLARRYGEITRFGDLYDHMRDAAVFLGLLAMIYLRCPMNKYWVGAVAVCLVGTLMHFGLVETAQTDCMQNDSAKGNVLALCKYVSNRLFRREDGKPLLTQDEIEQKYCRKLLKTCQWTRWVTDVNLVLLLFVYLFTR